MKNQKPCKRHDRFRLERKKDKRMLVLFAFGLFVLLLDCIHSIRPLLTCTVTKPEHMERAGSATLSPRLAFFYNQPIPINQAVIQDLTLLPGIGEQLAGRIIAFRDKNGGIHSRSDLEQIAGIGRKLSRKISGFVTFSQP